MSRLDEIKKSVSELSSEELHMFSDWLVAFMEDRWDKQIETDAASGKLDALAEQALAEFQSRPKTRN